jgi:hypothetical protein
MVKRRLGTPATVILWILAGRGSASGKSAFGLGQSKAPKTFCELFFDRRHVIFFSFQKKFSFRLPHGETAPLLWLKIGQHWPGYRRPSPLPLA